ncbi:MAG: nucleoside-diphosphate kinase [bacterium]|nr:nucleoside-diphosphate kinase [bacterium]
MGDVVEDRTLILIKPDAVRKGLTGRIISRFEDRGFKIIAVRMLTMSSDLADSHYIEHIDKGFYPEMKKFIMSGPLVAMVIDGENAVRIVRAMVGATDSVEAAPGTIRGDFSLSKRENAVHASDCSKSAEREIELFFPEI